MTTLLIDARYYGNILRTARNHENICARHAAYLLKISHSDILKYEKGVILLDDGILHRIFISALRHLYEQDLRRQQDKINRKHITK